MKNNLYLITLILFILSFTLADSEITDDMGELSYWSWMNCRETLKKYSLYRASISKITKDKEDQYFKNCIKPITTEYKEKCEKKMEPLADITKSYFHECAIPYQYIIAQNKEFVDCGKEFDACSFCVSDEGKSAGCKTIKDNHSDKQVEYNAFKKNLQENCQISTTCHDDLESYAQDACFVAEKNQCKVDWLSKYSPQDPCLINVLCQKSIKGLKSEKIPVDGQNQDNSFSIITEFSLLILLALFWIL